MAVAIVNLAQLGINQSFVCFGNFDELALGCWITWVLVWVILLAELPISGLDLLVACLSVYAEYLVEVLGTKAQLDEGQAGQQK